MVCWETAQERPLSHFTLSSFVNCRSVSLFLSLYFCMSFVSLGKSFLFVCAVGLQANKNVYGVLAKRWMLHNASLKTKNDSCSPNGESVPQVFMFFFSPLCMSIAYFLEVDLRCGLLTIRAELYLVPSKSVRIGQKFWIAVVVIVANRRCDTRRNTS